MSPSPPSAPRYRFGQVEFDADAFQLRTAGELQNCPARALRLLQLLCAAPGRLFAREELIAALWPGRRLVSDESLSQVIFKLRSALGADGERLVSVRGAGLRLEGPVAVNAATAGPVDAAEAEVRSRSARREVAGARAADADTEAGPTMAAAEAAEHVTADGGAAQSLDLRQHVADAGTTDSATAIAAAITDTSAASDANAPNTAAPVPSPAIAASSAAPAVESDLRISLRRSRRLFLVAALLLVVAVVATLWAARQPAAPAVDWTAARAWGFAADNLHASRPETAARFAQALAADAAGDRARAQVLLAALHDGDAATPLPALLLTVWRASAGDRTQAAQWLQQARTRAAAEPDALVAAYLTMAQAFAEGRSVDIKAAIGALLDLRPDAWILRYAAAQLLHQRGQDELALAELCAIDVAALDDRRIEDLLALRAALGDAAGVRAVLRRLDAQRNPVATAALGALLAYGSGDVTQARRAFADTAELARRGNRDDWALRAALLAAVLAFEQGDLAEARHRVDDALAQAREKRETLSVLDANLMLAQVAHRQGDTTARDTALERAAAEAHLSGDPVWPSLVRIVALRLDGDAPDVSPADDADLATRDVVPLLRLRLALRDGDAARAIALLQSADRQASLFAEEWALAAAELGQPWPPLRRRDPPVMPYFRLMAWASLASARR
ncbi:winged helix-turn-helix domain-containing protein [Tahibacter sp. UC22_41]|uniref:winged helix-turn-helix domain-containing protein n=1 Tax=Tahibacter sp. UC22_41 TaxID=3350178 RepID=UPI0036DC194D